MKIITLAALAAVFSISAVFAADDDGKKPEKKKGDPAARFAKLDADSDGKVTLDEFKAGMKKNSEGAEKMMKAKDRDKDGSLTKEEFTAAPKKKGKGGDKKKEEAK